MTVLKWSDYGFGDEELGALSFPLHLPYGVRALERDGQHEASLVVAGLPQGPGEGSGTGADGLPSPPW